MNKNPFFKDFLWGAATAAYQIEGAAADGGRTPSVWDVFSHTAGKIIDGTTGDVACDHYNRFREDVALMKELGLNAYRMSISWSRILPDPDEKVNAQGVEFYRALFAECKAAGIAVMTTLFHWDMPVYLEQAGGWTNRETAHAFERFARVCFRELGGDVDYWCTINEPSVVMTRGHIQGVHAPGRTDFGEAVQAGHHMMLAHGLAVNAFREYGTDSKIGIVLNLVKYQAVSLRPGDRWAAFMQDSLHNSMFLTACSKGHYPLALSLSLRRKGLFPKTERDDMRIIAAPCDFVGVNYYYRDFVRKNKDAGPLGAEVIKNPNAATAMGWEIYPEGLYMTCQRAYKAFRLPVYVTESGVAFDDRFEDGAVHDSARAEYLKAHIEQVGELLVSWVDMRGYFVWTLMDNFEWARGNSARFGLYYTDYATQRRIPKDSAEFYRGFIARARGGGN